MGRQADSSLERMQCEGGKKRGKRQRQKDESSLRDPAHCQIVNVKSHNYTERASANREQQTRDGKTRDRERMTEKNE